MIFLFLWTFEPKVFFRSIIFWFDLKVNVVVVSDHGMVEIDENKNTKLIDIETIIDPDDIEVMLDRGTTSFLIPKPNKENKVCLLFHLNLLLLSCSISGNYFLIRFWKPSRILIQKAWNSIRKKTFLSNITSKTTEEFPQSFWWQRRDILFEEWVLNESY